MRARTCVLIASLSRRAVTDSLVESAEVCSRSGDTTWICASDVYCGEMSDSAA